MSTPEPSVSINVDRTNPGQFFACCGLLELADRLWDGARGWFENRDFCIVADGNLADLVSAISHVELKQLDPSNDTSSPIGIDTPFRPLRLDWWLDERAGGKELKVWAGRMDSVRIARAMQYSMRNCRFHSSDLFNVGVVAFDPDNLANKVEPFYFDARRGPNAHSRDVGFSPDKLEMMTTAFPAVELLCLFGLQRCLPAKTNLPRIFRYSTWSKPTPPELLPPIVAGELSLHGTCAYQFENWYRTGQKKHKAFRSAVPVSAGA